MDTRHLDAALAVARHGSFTAAARALYLDQSTLSRHIGALERSLGAPLFVRGLRTVTLTSEGAAFLPEAAGIMDAVGRAEALVHRHRGRPGS